MRTRTMIGLLGVIVSAVCVVPFAGALYGQQGRADDEPTRSKTESHVSTPDELLAEAQRNAVPQAIPRNLAASYTMGPFDVNVVDNQVAVSTSAHLYDRRPMTRFRWTLRVYDEHFKTKFVDRKYDDQIFSVPRDEPQTPTFDDVVKLAPGSYQVMVILHSFLEGFDVSSLDEKDVDESHRAVAFYKPVTIGR